MLGGPCQDWSTTTPFSKMSVRWQLSGGGGEPIGMLVPTPTPAAPPPPILMPPMLKPTLELGCAEPCVIHVYQ